MSRPRYLGFGQSRQVLECVPSLWRFLAPFGHFGVCRRASRPRRIFSDVTGWYCWNVAKISASVRGSVGVMGSSLLRYSLGDCEVEHVEIEKER